MTWYGVEGQRKVTNHGVNGDLRELACRAIFKMPPKGPSDELEADFFTILKLRPSARKSTSPTFTNGRKRKSAPTKGWKVGL